MGGFGARPSGVVSGVSGISISPSDAAPSSDVGDVGAGAGAGAGGGSDAVAVDAIWPCLRLSPAVGSGMSVVAEAVDIVCVVELWEDMRGG